MKNENLDNDCHGKIPFLTKIDGSLIFHLRQIYMTIFRIANKRIEEYSIPVKMEQMPVLMSLYVYGDLSQQDLANYIKRDKSSVYRTANILEKKGLIEYKKDENDARKKLLALTETGKFVSMKIEDSTMKIEDEIRMALSDKPKMEMINFLKETAERLESLENS